jgi:hypothetical protein
MAEQTGRNGDARENVECAVIASVDVQKSGIQVRISIPPIEVQKMTDQIVAAVLTTSLVDALSRTEGLWSLSITTLQD